MPIDAIISHATDAAFSQTANAFDKWTTNRDEKRAATATVSTDPTTAHLEDISPLPGELTTLPDGTQSYFSSRHAHLSQLPMFPLYHANDDHCRAKSLKLAQSQREQIYDLDSIPAWKKGLMSLTGGGMIFTVKKFENSLNRLGAQNTESKAAQTVPCILTRWTAPLPDTGIIVVDMLEFRTSTMGMHFVQLLLRANADVNIKVYELFETDVKKGKMARTGGKDADLGVGVVCRFQGGQGVRMELVAKQTRATSMAEMMGGLRHRGTSKRFEKEWEVPVMV